MTEAKHDPESASHAKDSAAVTRVVTEYAAGLRDGDVSVLKRVFHPQAIVSGYLGREGFVKPVSFLYEFVAANESPATLGDPFSCTQQALTITGDTAVATLLEKDYLDYDYVTNLHMMSVDGRWCIVSKLFSGTPAAR